MAERGCSSIFDPALQPDRDEALRIERAIREAQVALAAAERQE
jgi:hypothetical protein